MKHLNYLSTENYRPQTDCRLQPLNALDSHHEPPHSQPDMEVTAAQEWSVPLEDAPEKRRAVKSPPSSSAQWLRVPLDHVLPRHDQPRRTFDPIGLAELTAFIKTSGVLQPVLVRPLTPGQLAEVREADWVSERDLSANALYRIIAGECRWRASLEAGLAQIPIRLNENVSDDTAAEIAKD